MMAGEHEGTPIVGVLVMGAIVVFCVGGPAVVVVLLWRAGKRQRRETRERWERALVAQGFTPAPIEANVRLERAGVTFDASLFERGAPQYRHWVTQVCARHGTPLGLGLQVDQIRPEASSLHEWPEWLRSASGAGGLFTGVPELDRHFIVRAGDPRGALVLLRTSPVVEALRGAIAARHSLLVRLHDYGAVAEIRGVACDERSIQLAMFSAETIARAVATGRGLHA